MMTAEDEMKLLKSVTLGMTQGGPASPALYNNTAKDLIRRVLHVLKILDDNDCPVPFKTFADYIALKLASDAAAAIALRSGAAGRPTFS